MIDAVCHSVVAGLMLVGSVQGRASSAAPNAEPLAVRAWISTAGPYSEMWDLSLTPEGQVGLQVFYSQGSGSIGLVVSHGGRYLAHQAGVAVAIDSVMVLLFVGYLVGVRSKR